MAGRETMQEAGKWTTNHFGQDDSFKDAHRYFQSGPEICNGLCELAMDDIPVALIV